MPILEEMKVMKKDIKKAEIELAALKKSVEDEKVQMEIEYNQRLNEMEPMLVETILTVFEKVTHVLAEDKKRFGITIG